MTLFEYVAWFQNDLFAPGDQDHEWPACFVVNAPSIDLALQWGDRLSRSYTKRTQQRLLRSAVEPLTEVDHSVRELPIVNYGDIASDKDIGW